MNSKTLRNSFLLFLAAGIWGFAFVSQSKGMEVMQPLTFNGIRSLLGAATVFPIMCCRVHDRKKKAAMKEAANMQINWQAALKGGLLCGLVYTVASTLQQVGIAYTTVGKAGFITTLYIIFVPFLGIFLKKKIPGVVFVGAGMALAGMYLLCMTEQFSLTRGDSLVLISAVLFAVHILLIDYYAPKTEGVILSFLQLLVCGVICTAFAFLWENPSIAQLQSGAGPILYAGVMSCGVAYTLQIIGQKGLNPTIASLILSLESVVATLAGFAAYKIGFLQTDQTLTQRQIAGCVLVFAAVILAQLPPGKKNKK